MQAHLSTHTHAQWAEAAPWLALLLTVLLTLLLAFGLALCSGPQRSDPGGIPFPLAGTQDGGGQPARWAGPAHVR
jgi:hypothetical protein